MSNFVPEQTRLDFLEVLSQADHDSRTEGMFIVMVAPTREGFSRDAVLVHGKLPVEPVLGHVVDMTLRALRMHKNASDAQPVHE